MWTVVDEYQELQLQELDRRPGTMLARILPTETELVRIALAQLSKSSGCEVIPAQRNHRKLWLASDPDGPGYSRQRAYGAMRLDFEASEDIHHNNEARRQLALDGVKGLMADMARGIADKWRERVSTFRAVNHLDTSVPVTIRPTGSLLRYAVRHPDDGPVMIDVVTDSLIVRLVSYFVVCPAGDEWIPKDGDQ